MRLTTRRPSLTPPSEKYPEADLDGHIALLVLRDGTEVSIREGEPGALTLHVVGGETNINIDGGKVVIRDGSKIDLDRTYTSDEQRWYGPRDMTGADLAAGDKVWSQDVSEYVVINRIEDSESARRLRLAVGHDYDIKYDGTVRACQEIREDNNGNRWHPRIEAPVRDVKHGDKVWHHAALNWAIVDNIEDTPGKRVLVFTNGDRKPYAPEATVDVCPAVRD